MKNFYIYGRNTVVEAIKSGKNIEKIYLAFGSNPDFVSNIYSLAKKFNIPCSTIDKKKFAELEKNQFGLGTKTQGVIALISGVQILSLDELFQISHKQKNPIIIALDEINDPHNLGAIARTAECANVAGIVITERNSAPLSPAAFKTSAGALDYLPVAKTSSLIQAISEAKKNDFWVYGTDSNAKKIYIDEDFNRPVFLIIGSEGKGIRESTKKHCDVLVKIPLLGKISSLNASVATGIVLFEILSQRNFKVE
jgi:23S rRNA (guanosine2251-2'-O)-methyltransferase